MKLVFASLFCIFLTVSCFYKMCGRHRDCTSKNEFLCCLCSAPGCYTNDDCSSSTACAYGTCIGIRKKRNINITALDEYNLGYICKSDDDCEDEAFCFNGDCAPSFMKKEHERFKRGEAYLPGGANKVKGFRCSCSCRAAENYPPECKKLLQPCQHDDDCRNDNSMCVENLCTKIWPKYRGDNEAVVKSFI